MIIRVDVNSDEALYVQLMNQIKYGVANGYLKPKDKLPSVRGLASELGINMHTVSKAYNLLKDEGLLLVSRKGVTVSDEVLTRVSDDYLVTVKKKIDELVYECEVNGVTEEEVITMVKQVYKGLGGK